MFNRILIANRSEIAVRIMRTARRLGVETVAVYSDADADAMHVRMADQAIHIGPSTVAESYLKGDVIIEAALRSGAQAIHPGYGFLSENAGFVDAVNAAGLVFVGPSSHAIRAMGLKDAAKTMMQESGVPVVPGYHGGDQNPDLLAAEALRIGYPVMIKARAGGGGKGMRLVDAPEKFMQELNSAAREAAAAFGDSAVLIEKFILQPRHIEVQVFGDNHGNIVHLFERDCSLQRRHQKVVEEAPAPGMSEAVRSAMTDAAIIAARAINYSGAGTVEFIVDGSGPLRPDGFWFMEMNTRLQVEHPVTEAITGIDLVDAQLRVASGEVLPFVQSDIVLNGHAVEARVYAEDVASGFLPATGQIHYIHFEDQVRVDTGVCSGDNITPFYDPMIAKIISHGESRSEALRTLQSALAETHVAGTTTNIDFLRLLLQLDVFAKGGVDTGLIERHASELCSVVQPDRLSILIAAVVFTGVQPQNLWNGWRLFGCASHLVKLSCQQVQHEYRMVLLDQSRVQLQAGHEDDVLCQIEIVERSDTSLGFIQDGCRHTAHIVQWADISGDKVSLLVNGRHHEFQQADILAGTTPGMSGVDALIAPMTGIVRLLDVVPGQSVTEGERLIVMEAMKMETSLVSPRSGVIESITCSVGDSVEGGSVLVHLQDPTDNSSR
ncbi:MAG: biotin carboxylase N-terminal domain-containing protein [Granulosicoccus sp.]